MQGQYDPEYKDILEAVSAIIFLSTPHRGTNLADTLNRILQASIISSSKQFISELTKNSFTLQTLNEQFRHVAPKLDIVSFYETRMTPIGIKRNKVVCHSRLVAAHGVSFSNLFQMVLGKDSSVLGYPGEISRALDADHHGVCKFDSPDDPLYVNVRNVLKSLVGKYPLPSKLHCHAIWLHPSLYIKALAMSQYRLNMRIFVRSKNFLPPNADYIFFRDRWVPNTCNWILKQEPFSKWLHDTTVKPIVLWLHGPAASGKSVLSSFVINHLAWLGSFCQYFFMRFGDQNKRSLSVLLRSLAYQVAQSLPSFRKGIVQLIAEATKFDTADAQTIWSRVFRSILFKIRLEVPLYWVIDGLEESDDPRALIKLLSDINLAVLPIRILIVSRRTQGLASSFQRLSKEVQVDMVPYEGNTTDIHSFVDQELDVSGDDKFKSYVRHQILQRAGGNFLWVHFAVQRINDCHTSANVERALEQLPSGMEALYNRMATSVVMLPQQEDKQLAASILGWVTCALRLLTIEELSLILEKDVSRPLDLQRSIGDLCGGFVIVDNGGNIAMVHQTAREYLIEGQDRPFSIDPVSAHARLFARCMHCLMDFGLRSKIARKQIPAFLDYAAPSWFYHLSHSHIESQDMIATLSSFFNGPSVLTWIQSLAQSNRLGTLILASTQLTCFVKRQYESVSTALPLHSRTLLEAWATDFVRIVGKFGTNLLKNPESIYKLIPPFCPHDSVMY